MNPPRWIASDGPVDLLIVRLSALGDIVHTIPAVQSLKRQLPQARIHWLSEKPYVPFLKQVEGVDQVWEANTRTWRKGLSGISEARRLIEALRGLSLRAALDFQGLLKSAVLGKLARPEALIGFHRSALRESAASWFYTSEVSTPPQKRHRIETCFDLLSALGLRTEGSARIDLNVPESAARSVQEKLQALEMVRPVLLSPGAGWPTKLWPARNYGLLAQKIETELNHGVVFVYGPGEEPLVKEAQVAAAPFAPAAAACDILELSALCLQARLMIASDTGPLHLAAALGARCVALMGPTHPWRNGPFGDEHSVVQFPEPCPNPYKRRCRNHFCMDIPVEDAFEAVRKQLEE